MSIKCDFFSDSVMIVHEPGTGKTITQLKSMIDLLKARDFYGVDPIIDIAKGKYKAPVTIKELKVLMSFEILYFKVRYHKLNLI